MPTVRTFNTNVHNLLEVQRAFQDLSILVARSTFDAVLPPDVTDDIAQGWRIGSRWLDVNADQLYTCVDTTEGAAVWRRIALLVIGGPGDVPTTAFTVVGCPSGTNPVSDSVADTLNLATDHAGLTITGDSATDTVTFDLVEGSIDHDALSNFAANEHFTEASIDHTAITNIGTTSHADIDTHIGIALTAAAVVADDTIVRGAGGARGLQDSTCYILDNGNVGIGIATPNELLHVSSAAATDARVLVAAPDGYDASLQLFEKYEEGTGYGFEFEYDGGDDKLYLWSRKFAGNEAIRMTWLKTGYVGIGETTPTSELHVAGDITVTGTVDGVDISAHAARHQSAGADAIKLDDLAAPDNNTDLDTAVAQHGLCPKLDDDDTHYLDGKGAWTVPAGGGGGAPTDATYVCMGLDGDLSAERVLTGGDGIVLTDGGANGNATLSVDFGDDEELVFGDDDDVKIDWKSNTGALVFGVGRAANQTGCMAICNITHKDSITPTDRSLPYLRLYDSGGIHYVDLYHDSSNPLITWNTGTLTFSGAIDVTGNITVSGDVDGVDVAAHVSDTTTHGTSGDIVGTTDTQTLSGKTITDLIIDECVGFDAVYDNGNVSGEVTINWNNGNMQTATLTGNVTGLAFTNPPNSGFYHLRLIQDGTGNRTVVWDDVDYWIRGGTTPVVSTGAADRDWFDFRFDGTVYEGSHAENFATPV